MPATRRSAPSAAAIILPDGTLQEAGSIVWNDGTCLGYGRGRSPNDPEFMFRRDVDYCSGAFLLTPTALFRRLGGFDERYAPAYYEETDYCVRLWKEGLRVVFEPEAAILHFEFGSAGARARARPWSCSGATGGASPPLHADWLRGQLPPSQLNELPARKARPARQGKRVLMLEDRVPKPTLGSGYPRSRDILHELVAAGAEVTFYPMYRHRESWPEVRATVGPTVETFILGSADQLGPFLESRRGYYDALLVCRCHNMERLVELEALDPTLVGDARVIYDAEAVFARRDVLRERTSTGARSHPRTAGALVADEVVLTRLAHTVVSVSDAERQLFQDHGVAPVVRLGHAVEVAPTPAPFAERTRILFLGAVHDDNSPNADSLRWFADDVLPALRQRLGREDLRLTVVGLNQAATIAALDGKDLDLVGPVDDLAPCFDQARLVVVPTRFAAGIPHKVHQAAALGVPVVATELIAARSGGNGRRGPAGGGGRGRLRGGVRPGVHRRGAMAAAPPQRAGALPTRLLAGAVPAHGPRTARLGSLAPREPMRSPSRRVPTAAPGLRRAERGDRTTARRCRSATSPRPPRDPRRWPCSATCTTPSWPRSSATTCATSPSPRTSSSRPTPRRSGPPWRRASATGPRARSSCR